MLTGGSFPVQGGTRNAERGTGWPRDAGRGISTHTVASRPSFLVPRSALWGRSELYLRPEFTDSLRRQSEVLRRAAGVAREAGEQALAPDRHAGARSGDQRLAAEEEGAARGVDVEP